MRCSYIVFMSSAPIKAATWLKGAELIIAVCAMKPSSLNKATMNESMSISHRQTWKDVVQEAMTLTHELVIVYESFSGTRSLIASCSVNQLQYQKHADFKLKTSDKIVLSHQQKHRTLCR